MTQGRTVAIVRALRSDEVKTFLNNSAIAIDRDPFYGKIRRLHNKETARVKRISRVFTNICRWDLDPTQPQRRFGGVSLDVIDDTLKATTQLARRIGTGALTRCYSTTKIKQLWYRHLNVRIYGDTMKAATKRSHGNKYAHLMCSANILYFVHPMPVKSAASTALEKFFRKFGIMTDLHTDSAPD